MLDISAEYARGLSARHPAYEFTVDYGRKFDKIVQRYETSDQRSVHAFIERATGRLIKASGWDAPQRDKDGLAYRYDISTAYLLNQTLTMSDPYGSYLYKK